MQIEIVVLNWNNYSDTRECLLSLRKLNYPNYRITLVDNGSMDGSGLKLAREFPSASFIETGKNLGYAGGNNIGIKKAVDAGADIVLVLNNDVVVDSADLLTLISDTMQEGNRIGIVGPRIYDYVNRKQRLDIYDKSLFHRGMDLFCLKFKKRLWKTQNGITLRTVDRVSGSALAFSREMLEKVGFFDDRFFLYAEEIEICFRAIFAGYEVAHIDDDISCVFHKSKVGYVPPVVWYYITRNMLYLINKLFRGWKWCFAFFLHMLVVMHRTFKLTMQKDFKSIKCCAEGFRDGLLGKMGKKA
jgi:GT2 family glycosyltransferase